MEKHRLVLALAGVAYGALCISVPAQAGVGFGMLPSLFSTAAFANQPRCASPIAPAAGDMKALVATDGLSKSEAILGGQVSRLAMVTLQQVSLTLPISKSAEVAFSPMPATSEPRSGDFNCQSIALPVRELPDIHPAIRGPSPLGRDNFLASKRLPIRRTGFDAVWDRVQRDALPRGTASALLAVSSSHPDEAALAAVNAWTNKHVRYVEDRDQYGREDYWASAATTLYRGAGDCEDIAVAKLQLLAAMGVSRKDMYLVIARDLVRHANHALLVVQLNGKNWLLDNATDRVLDASASYDYRPILSFNNGQKWLHGY